VEVVEGSVVVVGDGCTAEAAAGRDSSATPTLRLRSRSRSFLSSSLLLVVDLLLLRILLGNRKSQADLLRCRRSPCRVSRRSVLLLLLIDRILSSEEDLSDSTWRCWIEVKDRIRA